jgi:hypothetical protein
VLRVAYWQASDGAHGQVVVRSSDIVEFERVRKLRSTCDVLRDEFLPALVEWAGRPGVGRGVAAANNGAVVEAAEV